jgi:enoyl-CoA hydratase/carnithine racemase
MSEPVILVEKHGEAALVTLNRPAAMNALSRELRGMIAETFDRLEADPGTRVVVLTGAGRRFARGSISRSWVAGRAACRARSTRAIP